MSHLRHRFLAKKHTNQIYVPLLLDNDGGKGGSMIQYSLMGDRAMSGFRCGRVKVCVRTR